MKKITGGLTFIAGLTGLGILIFWLFEDNVYGDTEEGFVWIVLLLIALSVIYYSIVSKFWDSKHSVIDSLERETEIIKKKIEKRELLTKLEKLEQNEKMP